MNIFNWEDYEARVADYVVGGMDKQSAELQVQYEMSNEADEYEQWSKDMELAPDLDDMADYYGA